MLIHGPLRARGKREQGKNPRRKISASSPAACAIRTETFRRLRKLNLSHSYIFLTQ